LRAYRVFLGLELLLSATSALAFTVTGVYFVREGHFTPLQLVLNGTVMELAYFLLGVPTGIFADAVSRRLCVAIGLVLQGAGLLVVGATTSFGVILAGYAVWGTGAAFFYGAYEAWLTDELGLENVGGAFLRGARLGMVGSLVGIVGSVALASVSLRLAIEVGGALTLLLSLAWFVMPEEGFSPAPRSGRSLRELAAPAVAGARLVRARPVLLLMLGIAACWGMSSEAFDRLYEAHFLRDIGLPHIGSLQPVVWFGILAAASILLSIGASTVLARRVDRETTAGVARSLLVVSALLAVAVAVFGAAGSLALALTAYLAARVLRSVGVPLYTTWLNRNVDDSSVRATVLSISEQADAIGQWTGGPAIGAVGSLVSLRAALLVGAAVLSPAVALYARALRHGGQEPELEALPAVSPQA
jgi:DHA3 family tetracycline resistance protein-like MFS transporter